MTGGRLYHPRQTQERWCKRHQRFSCSCGRKPNYSYSQIDHAILRVLEIYAGPDKPMEFCQIQRMIVHLGVERSQRALYYDLERLQENSRVIRVPPRGYCKVA